MNRDELKVELDKIDTLKTLKEGTDLIVSFRNIHVTKNFGGANDSYIIVSFEGDVPVDVETYPLRGSGELWCALDCLVNIGKIQPLLR